MPSLPEHDVITPTLLRRFRDEGAFEDADGRHCGLILRDGGRDLIKHAPPDSLDPSPEQLLWAGDILRLLNRELHHDGAWVVVFTHVLPVDAFCILRDVSAANYGRYALIWVDQDADPQFTVEWQAGEGDLRTFVDVMLAGVASTGQKCEMAWEIWQTHMRKVLEPKLGQLFRRAKGERAPSVRH